MAVQLCSYSNNQAKLVIVFLTFGVCYLSLVLLEPRTCDQIFFHEGNATKTHKPILILRQSYNTSVVRDVCQRWGYTILRHSADGKVPVVTMVTEDEIIQKRSESYDVVPCRKDFYTVDYCKVITYRIFQTQASNKIVDYLPELNRLIFTANLVSKGGKYIPKGFMIPQKTEEFLQYFYSLENKGKRWIQKNYSHRGNIVRTEDDLDLKTASLYQEFIGNPLIIDGRKFSLSIYVAFASGNPLRAYVLESAINLRFCEKEYYPENLNDPATYITDGHELYDIKYNLQVEPLKTYRLKYNYNEKKAFEATINSTGKDPAVVFAQIYDAIHDVLNKSVHHVESNSNSDIHTKYVELTRWDFIIDADLSVYLIEINYSPAFGCKIRPTLGKDYCHHSVYNLFRVMGLERPFQWNNIGAFHIRGGEVHVLDKICYSTMCTSCASTDCRLCSHCLPEHQNRILKQVVQEHFHRTTTGFIYPYINNDVEQRDTMDSLHYRYKNHKSILTHWLQTKCMQDKDWCSRY